jgi:hypothetical protein
MAIDTVAALAGADPRVFWLDSPHRPASRRRWRRPPAPTWPSSVAASPAWRMVVSGVGVPGGDLYIA